MAYDEDLADRIREQLGTRRGVVEKKMFGGLAFLVRGHMAVAASGQGGLLVRADPARTAALTRGGAATVMVMRGREMPGWLRVDAEHVRTTRQLARWVRVATDYVDTLPAKR
ncbi:MAG TPA: TfoX/Sxy family protein [Acidimicrobiales bacterium]|nr:TfoX/Sxy family protein [Acidimicrobiales bacterium]